MVLIFFLQRVGAVCILELNNIRINVDSMVLLCSLLAIVAIILLGLRCCFIKMNGEIPSLATWLSVL